MAHSDGRKRPEEFDLIREYFKPLAATAPEALDLTDDAALLRPRDGCELVVAADMLVADVHFLAADPPETVACKALRVNLSDLAAMGAAPRGYLMTIALPPAVDRAWLDAMTRGLARDQDEFGVGLLGGDTVSTKGPLTISITALGEVPSGAALRRNGARPGDLVFVSGTIGDARLGLEILNKGTDDAPGGDYLVERYRLPMPRLGLGQALRGLATAAIDISDGLVADLGHICEESGIGAEIVLDRVPVSPAAAKGDLPLADLVTGGDDYELLFTIPPDRARAISRRLGPDDPPVQPIGEIIEGEAPVFRNRDGTVADFSSAGWRHR